MKKTEVLAEALTAYSVGDPVKAADLAGRAGSTLGVELRRYLTEGEGGGPVYDQPSAFTAFIRGGGNVKLYRRLSEALARRYGGVGSLLDLGCGDGLAVVPALEQADRQPGRIDLVEPSSALLDEARKHLDGTHGVYTWDATAQEFLARDDDRQWQLTQSTFALQSIPTAERTEVLRALRPRTSCLVLAEFDVPEYDEESAEYVLSLVTRYERGISEYGRDASLVAQGFLLPILLGLVDAGKGRTNWEQPATDWASQLKEAGFTGIRIEPLVDYWWSPAVLITAS